MFHLEVSVTYFTSEGVENTTETFRLTRKRAEALGIKQILLPTTFGNTAVKAIQKLKGFNIIAVTHVAGYDEPGKIQLLPENRKKLETAGVTILTTTHALSGVERGIRRKFDTVGPVIIIAQALRMLGQGIKVAVEITLMAADAGLIPMDQSIIALGGTGRGVDTATVIKPAHSHNVFDLRIEEIICKPR